MNKQKRKLEALYYLALLGYKNETGTKKLWWRNQVKILHLTINAEYPELLENWKGVTI